MNKNLILIGFLLISFIQLGICQIEFGLKGGYTNSWPGYGEIELPEDAQTHVDGFNISFFIGSSIKNGFGFNINPGYIKRGAACFPGWQPVFEGDSKVFLNYIEIPLMINKKFNLNSFRIVPSFGYGFSYLISASVHQELSSANGVETVVSKIEVGNDSDGSFNRLDHGFYFNVRFDRTLSQNHFIFIESSFYYGLKDYDQINTSRNRNLNFNFGFGYII